MKKVLSLLLCALMLLPVFTACGAAEDEDKGATIPVLLATQPTNFDPATALYDESGAKILGLIYSGLTYIDEKGKLQLDLAKSWKTKEDPEKNYYMLEITLNDTKWSDGRAVSADDVVFAWKRILEPDFQSEAASLLMGIKNARAVKRGDMSIDDLGVYAADTSVVQIEFETKPDYELFLRYCASPALYPLREDVVLKADDWATNTTIIVGSGPFGVRNFSMGKTLVLERNIYYYRNIEKEDSITKYVVPYRLAANYEIDSLAGYNDGSVLFISELPLAERKAYADKVTISDTLSTASYYFNTTKAPFDNANVRKALSLALDRNAIVDIVTYAKAATGFVPAAVYDYDNKTSFRTNGGDVISATANLEEAKKLLSGANANGNYTLTVRKGNAVDLAVAEYAIGVWKSLGLNFTVKELGTELYEYNEYDLYRDDYIEAYETGDYDVIAIDAQALTNDAFPVLAPFALSFAGGAMDLVNKNYDEVPHLTGYNSAEYNAVIEEAYAAATAAERSTALHKAEGILANDMPVIPLFVYQNAYMKSDELSGITMTYFGTMQFKKTSYKNYLEAQAAAEAAAAATAN